MSTPTITVIADADAMRAHLDALNESGTDYRAAGMDAQLQPFLITLSGPYAETEDVFFGSPWDGEVDYGTGEACEECGAANSHGILAIRYPAHVIIRPAENTAGGAS